MSEKKDALGGCLCGETRYKVSAQLRPVVACHCRQCQRSSGFHVAATSVPKHAFSLLKEQHLKWYTSSATAQRGFCGQCGSNLFWKQNGSADMVIFAGTIDQPTGLKIVEHIFVEDKGDYYALNDDLPKRQGFEESICFHTK